MAEQKKSYPMLPIAHWWALRKKFKQSIPGVVTDSYLATVLAFLSGLEQRVHNFWAGRAAGIAGPARMA